MIISTWNMQGGANTPYINQVVQSTQANVLCLQECGALAEHLTQREPIIAPTGAILGYTGIFHVGHQTMRCVYWEDIWIQGSLAVLSNIALNAYGILGPVAIQGFAPKNPRALPWINVATPTGNNITIYSIHSPPVYGNATLPIVCAWNNAQINQINVLGGTWACTGDFNASSDEPAFLQPPQGVIVRGNKATQHGGGILDYAITNAAGLAFRQMTKLAGASDHYPQVFQL